MSDIIELLPDSVANQIAAGEVIQRPASLVKELLENSIDAHSKKIQLIVKDAGKTLVRVVDDGHGMSETDARLCFERHATSKIKTAEDLFKIRTKGFRGEALASIAAIAHVELVTKLQDQELGTKIFIEGCEVKSQEPCASVTGTSFSVKNLFFNVPARRKFLKSNPVEFKHIIEEFHRVALAHPDIEFILTNNNEDIYNLKSGKLRQRIVSIFGKNYNQRLVPVEEETDIVKVYGFVGKPEFARKTRGEQYLFVNNRFVKSAYLNHAILGAYNDLMPKGSFPSYFIFAEVNTDAIDVNIHPTKTEVKFEDEKAIYAILLSAVKQSLGKYNVVPAIDFDQETSFNLLPLKENAIITPPTISYNPDYNPFEEEKKAKVEKVQKLSNVVNMSSPPANWEDLFQVTTEKDLPSKSPSFNFEDEDDLLPDSQQVIGASWDEEKEFPSAHKLAFQLQRKYILTNIKSGFLIIDQNRAHERVLFERYLNIFEDQSGCTQKLLFPQEVELSVVELAFLKENEEMIKNLGFDFVLKRGNICEITGLPVEACDDDAKTLLEGILEQLKTGVDEIKFGKKELIALGLARKTSIKEGKMLGEEEIIRLIDELFACEMPYYSPKGKPIFITYTMDELDKRFEK